VRTWLEKHTAFNANCLPNVTDFSRFQAVTYTVRVVVSQKCCKMLLPHYTRKCHVGYRFVRFLMTLKVFTGCRPFQMQFDEHLCNVSRGFNWHSAPRGPSATAGFLVLIVAELVRVKEQKDDVRLGWKHDVCSVIRSISQSIELLICASPKAEAFVTIERSCDVILTSIHAAVRWCLD